MPVFGLGGYKIVFGKAWCFELPIECHLRTSLSSSEFLACIATIWINILSDKINME